MMTFRPGQRLVIPGVQVLSPRPSSAAFTGILDGISNVAAAYGLRKLRSAYAGSAVRVRRSSDSAEQDIGFASDGEFDTSAFSSFVGGGTGYVKTWYDQSGNSRDATQATTGSQPQIALNVTNGKPSVIFSSKTLSTASFAHFPSKRGTIFVVANRTNSDFGVTWAAGGAFFYFSTSGTSYKWFDAGIHNTSAVLDSQNTTGAQSLIRSGDTTSVFRRNGSIADTFTQSNNQLSTSAMHIGSNGTGGAYHAGHIFEIIELSVAISATDHNTIGNNMATRYGLSWTTVT